MGSMETTRPNLTMPARKVQASRRLGFRPEAIMGITATSETSTARRGFIEVMVSIDI
jgi:hypothetical protein